MPEAFQPLPRPRLRGWRNPANPTDQTELPRAGKGGGSCHSGRDYGFSPLRDGLGAQRSDNASSAVSVEPSQDAEGRAVLSTRFTRSDGADTGIQFLKKVLSKLPPAFGKVPESAECSLTGHYKVNARVQPPPGQEINDQEGPQVRSVCLPHRDPHAPPPSRVLTPPFLSIWNFPQVESYRWIPRLPALAAGFFPSVSAF